VHVRVPRRLHDRREARLGHAEEDVRVRGRDHRVERDVDGAVRAVLEADREGHARRELAVELRFGRAGEREMREEVGRGGRRTDRAPMAPQEMRSAMNCGEIVSRSSEPCLLGVQVMSSRRPAKLTTGTSSVRSHRSLRASRSPLLTLTSMGEMASLRSDARGRTLEGSVDIGVVNQP
jgi:hypothetical protein